MKRRAIGKNWRIATLLSFLLAALMILSVFAPMFGGTARVRAAGDDIVRVTETEDGVKKYIINDAVRITPVSDTLVRLEEKGKNGFEDRQTFYVLGRDEFAAPQSGYSVTDEVKITTDKYVVHVPKAASDLTGVFVTDVSTATIYKYNGLTLANTYLPSPSEELKGWYFSDNPRIVPGENGYSIIKEEGLAFNGWDFESEAPDVYVFVPDTYARFCKDYVTLTGKSNLIDLKTFGFWDSRWYIYDYESVVQQVQDYLDRGYSIDMITIDTNWRAGAVNDPGSTAQPDVGGMGYDIDKRLFPHMDETLQTLHDMGVNVIFNDHPEPVNRDGNGLDQDEIEYRSTNLKLILSMGLDMWWYDRNWSTSLNSADPDLSVYAWGMYAFQFIENEYYEELAAGKLEEFARRAIIMGNVDGCENGYWKYASDISSHRYTMQWTGDIGVDEAALSREIRNAIFGSAENGIPYVSADLGGHTSSVTDDMYTRWLQFGALTTITRVHCTHIYYCHQEGRMPWLFGDTAEEVTKEYVGMKYNLMPTFYSLAAENVNTGLPILRRLDIAYPQYPEAARNDEYLLGDGILVAPINEAYVTPPLAADFFTHTENGAVRNGLLGKYYSNKDFSGTPVYTKSDSDFVLNWGTASPKGLPADGFSVEWTGKFTVGPIDTMFSFFADDSVQVLIDGREVANSYNEDTQSNDYDVLLSTDYYDAGSTHEIRIRYAEDGGNAHFYMYVAQRTAKGVSYCYDTREVFLPDGTWIDVWSGKEYEGPYTYSVTHPLETSPIFVRKGTLTVLAPDMKNLNEKDWSELTLDAYPSASRAETTLYEDDTVTQAYKEGNYRTTAISAEKTGGKYTITIGAAEGTFEGAKAFTSRKWNIRLHAFEELGEVKSITVNGKRVTGMSYYAKDHSASPFSFTGASADTAVYMFSFSGNVDEETTIVVDFADNSKLATFAKYSGYDATPANFTIGEAEKFDGALDLDNEAYDDWAFFGNVTARKGGADHLIGEITSDFELFANEASAVCANWTNGEGVDSGENASNCVRGQVDVNVTLKVKAGESKTYTLFLVTEQCVGKLTVRDRAGNAKTAILDETADGLSSSTALNNNFNGRSARKVAITVTAEEDTEIYVRYSMHSSRKSGTGSTARLGISAIVCADEAADVVQYPDVQQEVFSVFDAPERANLSVVPDGDETYEVLDWYKTNAGPAGFVQKEGGTVIGGIEGAAFNPFGDFKCSVSWTDGEEVQSGSGTGSGYHTDSNGKFAITFHVDQNTKCIVLYVGAWNSSAEVTLYNYKYDRKGSAQFSAGGDSVCKMIKIPIAAEEETTISIEIASKGAHDSGNASLSAVQVIGTKS